jgi:hypothetical protein
MVGIAYVSFLVIFLNIKEFISINRRVIWLDIIVGGKGEKHPQRNLKPMLTRKDIRDIRIVGNLSIGMLLVEKLEGRYGEEELFIIKMVIN